MLALIDSILTTLDCPEVSDPINDCANLDSTVNLSHLTSEPDSLLALADKHLHVFPFKDVKPCWRRLYTDSSIAKSVLNIREHLISDKALLHGNAILEENGQGGLEKGSRDSPYWLDEPVRILDMAVIMTGAPGREEMVELIFAALQKLTEPPSSPERSPPVSQEDEESSQPPSKRRRMSPSRTNGHSRGPPESDLLPLNAISLPRIRYPIPRLSKPSLSKFEAHLSSSPSPEPLIITACIEHWPAVSSRRRSWRRISHLISHTLGGRRLVPVELGSSYTSAEWSQRIMPFKEFLSTYITSKQTANAEVGYLAQHHLLSQIPSLRPDISIPDYVYTDPPPPLPDTPVAKSLAKSPQAKLDEPIINTWFGPRWTVSPLHHDPWHGLLCQVMGKKYVRLYSPDETSKLYPRGMENGVDMSNTSNVDVERYEDEWRMERDMGVQSDGDENCSLKDEVSEGSDCDRDHSQTRRFPLFREAKYVEALLDEGEMLYIPVGWWHYVRSLSTSWSVSFWWN